MSEPKLKVPPHSLECEHSVLGGLMLDSQALDRIGFLKSSHFYLDSHRRIFEAFTDLVERGQSVDIVLLSEHLERRGDLEKAGGMAYLAALSQNTPSAFNIARYAQIVRDKATLRALISQAQELVENAWVPGVDPKELSEEAGAAFLNIELDEAPAEMVPFGVATVEAVEWADNPIKGLKTGYHELDRVVTGLMPGDLIVIAGRPSMGKTALAMNIAERIGIDKPVAIFSLEMTRRKIATRSLRYHEAQLGRDQAVDHLSSLKLYIDDTPSIGLGHMRLRLRRLKRQHGLALVVVDYLQLLRAKAENRTQEVSELSRGLKSIAKEFNVPVIAVAQLNRGADARTDRRPVLSDLRESGQIEQDADVIAFVYREEYYQSDTPWKGIAEVLVRKNRDGATDTVYLGFTPEYTHFHNWEGILPPREPKGKGSVASFADFKSAAAGDE